MSWQATAWALKQTTGSAGCKLLLLTLANYADEDGCCWPSQETLKNDTEQSVDTIQRQLKKLVARGLVRKIVRPMGPGRWTSWTYFLNIGVAKISTPQSAAWSDGGQVASESGVVVAPTEPHQTRDRAAPDPVTMPHQARDHAAPVRHEPSLKSSSESSLEASGTSAPKKTKPSAAERQKAFKESRDGIEVIQNRIARKLGSDGWAILMSLDAADLDRVTQLEERRKLDADGLDLLRSHHQAKRRGAA